MEERVVPIESKCEASVRAILEVIETQCSAGNCMYAFEIEEGARGRKKVRLKFKECADTDS